MESYTSKDFVRQNQDKKKEDQTLQNFMIQLKEMPRH
jgi:hypothetical protein